MNMFLFFSSIENVFQLSIIIFSLGLIIVSIEDIVSYPIYKDSGLLSWKIAKFGSNWTRKGFFSKYADFLLADFFLLTLVLKLFASVSLLVLSFFKIFPSSVLFLELILIVLMAVRSPYGLNGSFHMNLVLLCSLTLGSYFGMDSKIAFYCMWYVSFQLILSYFIAGIKKILSPIWRSACALNVIFSTNCYGNKLIYQLVSKNLKTATLISWAIMLFEILFFSVLFLNTSYSIFFIVGGLLFHFSTALFMGLNDFFFAFSATYPILIYCLISR